MLTNTTAATCIHDMGDPMWCSLCRASLGYRSGVDRQYMDCAVKTVETLTGATYEEAVAMLAANGRQAGQGTKRQAIIDTLAAAGWVSRLSSKSLDQALRDGGTYHVVAYKGRKGHSFAIVAGKAHNASGWLAGVRYSLHEVA